MEENKDNGAPESKDFEQAGDGGGGRRAARVKAVIAAAVVLLLVAVVTTWPDPARNGAAELEDLILVPGIGIVEKSQVTLLKAGKARVDAGHGYIEVVGLVSQPSGTYLSIHIDQVADFRVYSDSEETDSRVLLNRVEGMLRKIYLLDKEGREYRFQEGARFGAGHGHGSTTSATVPYRYWYSDVDIELPPLDEKTRLATLVVSLADGLELRTDIPLASPDEIREEEQPSGTVTRRRITVSAAAHFGTETRVSVGVFLPDSSARFHRFGARYGATEQEYEYLRLTGAFGYDYNELRGMSRGQPNYREIIFEGVHPGEREVTLNIPVLLLSEQGMDTVTVPVPPRGTTVNLNKVIRLGRYRVTLTKAEVVTYPHGDYLRVSVDLGPAGDKTLVSFSLPGGYSVSEINPFTGQWESFDLHLTGNEQSFELTLSQPTYAVEGPWTFTFPVVTQ